RKNAYVADLANVTVDGKAIQLPIFVMPGLSDYSLVVSLGYGRPRAGEVGSGVGVDVYDWIADFSHRVFQDVKIERLDTNTKLSSTQEQFAMNGDTVQEVDTLTLRDREPARVTAASDYMKEPLRAKK